MQEDKHNHYLSDGDLDAVTPTSGYAVVTPPPGYAPMTAPRNMMATPITEVGGSQIQECSDAAATAAVAGFAPELSTEVPGVGNLAFSKPSPPQQPFPNQQRRICT